MPLSKSSYYLGAELFNNGETFPLGPVCEAFRSGWDDAAFADEEEQFDSVDECFAAMNFGQDY